MMGSNTPVPARKSKAPELASRLNEADEFHKLSFVDLAADCAS